MGTTFYVGSHASIAKGLNQAVRDEISIGGNAIQVFLKNPRGRTGKPLDEEDAKLTQKIIRENKIFLVGHCSYLLNFAKPFKDYPWAVENLIDDLQRVAKIGGAGVVLHIGKYLEYSKTEAFENIVENIKRVLQNTPQETWVIWENTAGQGTEIGFKIEELTELYNSIEKHPRIKFCLDTCHAFAAGYDLSTEKGIKNWQMEFDQAIGWDKVVCLHFNDTKKECGSHVDRHEVLGKGMIGETGLKAIVKLAVETGKPLILETPNDMEGYKREIKMIKEWDKES